MSYARPAPGHRGLNILRPTAWVRRRPGANCCLAGRSFAPLMSSVLCAANLPDSHSTFRGVAARYTAAITPQGQAPYNLAIYFACENRLPDADLFVSPFVRSPVPTRPLGPATGAMFPYRDDSTSASFIGAPSGPLLAVPGLRFDYRGWMGSFLAHVVTGGTYELAFQSCLLVSGLQGPADDALSNEMRWRGAESGALSWNTVGFYDCYPVWRQPSRTYSSFARINLAMNGLRGWYHQAFPVPPPDTRLPSVWLTLYRWVQPAENVAAPGWEAAAHYWVAGAAVGQFPSNGSYSGSAVVRPRDIIGTSAAELLLALNVGYPLSGTFSEVQIAGDVTATITSISEFGL